jgi:hypothetical protein
MTRGTLLPTSVPYLVATERLQQREPYLICISVFDDNNSVPRCCSAKFVADLSPIRHPNKVMCFVHIYWITFVYCHLYLVVRSFCTLWTLSCALILDNVLTQPATSRRTAVFGTEPDFTSLIQVDKSDRGARVLLQRLTLQSWTTCWAFSWTRASWCVWDVLLFAELLTRADEGPVADAGIKDAEILLATFGTREEMGTEMGALDAVMRNGLLGSYHGAFFKQNIFFQCAASTSHHRMSGPLR